MQTKRTTSLPYKDYGAECSIVLMEQLCTDTHKTRLAPFRPFVPPDTYQMREKKLWFTQLWRIVKTHLCGQAMRFLCKLFAKVVVWYTFLNTWSCRSLPMCLACWSCSVVPNLAFANNFIMNISFRTFSYLHKMRTIPRGGTGSCVTSWELVSEETCENLLKDTWPTVVSAR